MPFNTGGGSNVVPFYAGGQANSPPNVFVKSSGPTSAFVSANLGDLYINTTTNACYSLVDKTAGVATWTVLGGGSSDVNTLTGDSGGAISPVGGTITEAGGTGITTVGSGNTITFNAVGGGLKTTVISGTSQAAAINNRYVPNNGGLVTVTMPAVAAVGSVVQITGNGAGGWLLQCNAGQTINSSGGSTTSGGSLASTVRYDAVEVVCVVANTTWTAEAIIGALTNA